MIEHLLLDRVPPALLRRLLDAHAGVTGVSACILDGEGTPLLRANPPAFCTAPRHACPFAGRHCRTDLAAVAARARQGERGLFRCASGAWLALAPVTLGNTATQYLAVGPFIIEGEPLDDGPVRRATEESPGDVAACVDALHAIPRYTRARADCLAASCRALAEVLGDAASKIGLLTGEIGRHRRTVEQLRATVERYGALFEAASDAVLLIDRETGAILDANTAATRLYDRTRDELKTLRFFDLSAAHDAAWPDPLSPAGLLQRRHHLRRDGRGFPVEVSTNTFTLGDRPMMIASVRDISANARLQAVERAAYEIAGAATTVADLPELYAFIHRALGTLMPAEFFYIALYDDARDQISFPYFVDVAREAPKPRPPLRGLTEYVIRTGHSLLATPEVFDDLVARGEVVQIGEPSVDWLGVPLRAGNHTIGVMCVQTYSRATRLTAEDQRVLEFVSGQAAMAIERKRSAEERRRLEAQVRYAQKLESLGVLAGGIAHDFNNLLTVIVGNADLARAALPVSSPLRRNLEDVCHASHRAADLCNEMLAYAGRSRRFVEPLVLSDVVRDMAHVLEVSVSRTILIDYDLAAGLPSIEADATQLRQVIINLVTNASDAIGDTRGVIGIRTGETAFDRAELSQPCLDDQLPEGRYVFLEVSDTGCGMDEDTRARIFDPFFTTKFTGRGLGLAAVLGIVRGHHGGVTVSSAPGQGSVFRVFLPAAPARPSA